MINELLLELASLEVGASLITVGNSTAVGTTPTEQ